jgi:hypothetical protein
VGRKTTQPNRMSGYIVAASGAGGRNSYISGIHCCVSGASRGTSSVPSTDGGSVVMIALLPGQSPHQPIGRALTADAEVLSDRKYS